MSAPPSAPASVLADRQSATVADNDIPLPDLKYGYRKTPMDWDELIDIIQVKQDMELLTRSVEQQRVYELYKRDIRKQYKSIYDTVLCSKFELEARRDPEGGLLYAYPPVSEIRDVKKALVLNDFPYCMEDGIEHWILWKLGGTCNDVDIEEAKTELREKLPDLHDILHWINPPHVKSLPDIDHVHILCRRGSRPCMSGC